MRVIKPVCGENGKEYDDGCLAKCAGVKKKCNGKCPCKKPCPCPRKAFRPICGENGKEYADACLAKCEGVKKKCYGKCPCKTQAPTPIEIWSCENKTEGAACQVSLCFASHRACRIKYWGKCSNGVCQKKPLCSVPLIHEPVCGEDGKTYGNSYEAACDGIKVECKEKCPCKKSCGCPKKNKPVCGETKGVIGGEREYENACLAKCKGVKKMCNGKCPCKDTTTLRPVDLGENPGDCSKKKEGSDCHLLCRAEWCGGGRCKNGFCDTGYNKLTGMFN